MVRDDLDSVLGHNRTARDVAWTIPIVLDLTDDQLPDVAPGTKLALTHGGRAMAAMEVKDVYGYDKDLYVKTVFGTDDPSHGCRPVCSMSFSAARPRYMTLTSSIGS